MLFTCWSPPPENKQNVTQWILNKMCENTYLSVHNKWEKESLFNWPSKFLIFSYLTLSSFLSPSLLYSLSLSLSLFNKHNVTNHILHHPPLHILILPHTIPSKATLLQLRDLPCLSHFKLAKRLRQPRRLVRSSSPAISDVDDQSPRPQQRRHRESFQRRAHAQDAFPQLPEGQTVLRHPRGSLRPRDIQLRWWHVAFPEKAREFGARERLR